MQTRLDALLTSGLTFGEDEDYLAFQFRLLNAVMLTGVFFSALFVLIDWAGLNHLGDMQLLATEINCLASALLILALRHHKARYTLVTLLFFAVNFATYLSALIFVVQDELRVIWFYIEIGVAYIFLGRRGGVIMTVITLLALVASIAAFNLPFSPNAQATLYISLLVTSVLCYAYNRRTTSYFECLQNGNRQLRELASKDPLTGLFNARAYYETTNRLIKLAQRSNIPYASLFIDLDHFKNINDQFGHEAGDRVLAAVAACLAGQLRQSDVLARIGGEEFVAFLPDTRLEGALQLGEKLRAAVAQLYPALAGSKQVAISASIGAAADDPTDISIADLQRRADRAMYEAKNRGRNRVLALP